MLRKLFRDKKYLYSDKKIAGLTSIATILTTLITRGMYARTTLAESLSSLFLFLLLCKVVMLSS